MNDSIPSRLRQLEQRVANVLRWGTIGTVGPGALATVNMGAITTAPRPWFTTRAGPDATWWAPEAGEQVMLLSPSGDFNQGVILPAIYQDSFPPPATAATQQVMKWADGSTLTYDRAAHTWTLNIAGSGSAINLTTAGAINLTATGKVTIAGSEIDLNGPVKASGTVDASGNITAPDVIGGGKSLKTHVHAGVQSGGASTAPPT